MRSRFAVLVVILALGVAAWLVMEVVVPTPEASSHADETASSLDVSLIEGDAPAQVLHDGPVRPVATAPGLESQRRAHGPVAVRVMDRWGRPFPNRRVWVVTPLRWVKAVEGGATTNARGGVDFSDVPYDGTYSIAVGNDPNKPLAKVPVTGRRVDVELTGLPLRVDAIASDTGRLLVDVPYTVKPTLEDGRGMTGYEVPQFLDYGAAEAGTLEAAFDAPPGYLAWDVTKQRFQISPSARELTYLAPLRPEAEVYVTLPEARPDWRYEVSVSDRGVSHVEAASDAFGRTRLHNIPFLPGAKVVVTAYAEKRTATGFATLEQDARDLLSVALRLPEPKAKPATTPKRASKPGDALYQFVSRGLASGQYKWDENRFVRIADAKGRVWSTVQVAGATKPIFQNVIQLDRKTQKASARQVVLRVHTPDGRPAVGARVRLGAETKTANQLGRVVFDRAPAGRQSVHVFGVGPSWSVAVNVGEGTRQSFDVHIQRPGAIVVQVIGKEGLPIPYARLEVKQASRLPWFDIQDGVQRLDPFTDHEGARKLGNLEPHTKITIRANVGDQVREIQMTVGAGETKNAVIDMSKPPKPKPLPYKIHFLFSPNEPK